MAEYFRLLQLAASGWLGCLAVLAIRSSRAVVVDFLFGRPKTGLSPISWFDRLRGIMILRTWTTPSLRRMGNWERRLKGIARGFVYVLGARATFYCP